MHRCFGTSSACDPADVICNSFLEALLDIQLCDSGMHQILAIEAAQLIASDRKYEKAYEDWDDPAAAHTPQRRNDFVKMLVADRRASQTLTTILTTSAVRRGIPIA